MDSPPKTSWPGSGAWVPTHMSIKVQIVMTLMFDTSALPSVPPSDIEMNQRNLHYFYPDLSAFKNKQN